MLLASALACITGCAQQTFTVQNKPAAVAPKKPSPIISSFLELGRRKPSICEIWHENLVKANSKHFINGLLGFIALGIYTPLEALLLLLNTIIAWVAHRYGQLYLHCSLIYFWVPSSCFCIVINSLWGWNNPVQRCLPVGGRLHYPRRRRWWLHALTDRLLMCNRRRPAATSSRRHHFRQHQLLSRVFCIERSNITLTHLHVSNCRVRQLQFLAFFVALGFQVIALSGNG